MMSHLLQNAQEVSEKARQMEVWQDRAYTAEKRVSGLEQERQKLRAEIERLHDGLKSLFLQATTPKLERAIAKILGHKVDCDWLLDGPCTCGGVEVAQ